MTLPPQVAPMVAAWPRLAQTQFTALRLHILDQAQTANIPVEETLKWGQPAFVPPRTIGTTLRIAPTSNQPGFMGLFVHCGTTIIEEIKALYPGCYDGTRGLLWDMEQTWPAQAVDHLINRALRYHSA